MSVFNSVSNALVVLMVVLMIAGGILGLAISDTDLFNPWTSQAQAERVGIDNSHQENIYQEEERKLQADTDIYIEQKQVELEKEKALAQSELEFQNQKNQILSNLLSSISEAVHLLIRYIGMAIPVSFVAVSIGYSMKVARSARRVSRVPKNGRDDKSISVQNWKDPVYKQIRIAEAKKNEHLYNRAQKRHISEPSQLNRQKPITWQDLLNSNDDR